MIRCGVRSRCTKETEVPRDACNTLLRDPIRLRGLITVNANQSTLSGIDAPIAGRAAAPLLRELIHSALSRAKEREHSLSPLSGLLRCFIDIYIRRLTRNDRQLALERPVTRTILYQSAMMINSPRYSQLHLNYSPQL